MKILLFGPNGQVGWELRRALAPLGTMVLVDRRGINGMSGDLTDLDGLTRIINTVEPDLIVNAAAYTAVDQAEDEMALARRINGLAPGVMGEAAKARGALVIHYSTDYVFDGSGDRAWTESDGTNPINAYGATKLDGECSLRDSGCRHLILRTSWVYSLRRANFVRTVLRLAQERDALEVVNDQFGAPTSAELIADVTAHILPRLVAEPGMDGTYHMASAGETIWHEYAQHIVEGALQRGCELKLLPSNIRPVPTEAFPRRARRPGNSRLNCAALIRSFGVHLPDWRIGVDRTLDELADLQILPRHEVFHG